ncbi:hypothetical protein SERLA73DRAFT_149159 [Serpula lacrymans var. lacrymans S7.3]|uniref:Uncharacterized protein n=2 Tax=Serpula lacrymans var. lacrymans TaxID=341189 RepID=F8PFX0_SERL3|nr:uncharacterized protein SERLADRAFT_404706 [Serpula lacrymans var. lacrymans S7.9]EGO04782.1 hypothetical protein SERLA73DRAFT_149159 [Serpula lacrymans var. lacrymans S7.3]EGO30611.1 hypothetical protein SERLADRAFT_404706 [Serpula lacrymans var. lacrymans S7.9]
MCRSGQEWSSFSSSPQTNFTLGDGGYCERYEEHIKPESDRVGVFVEVITAGRERYQLQLQDVKKPSLLSLPVDHHNPPDPPISGPSKPSSGTKHTSDEIEGEEPVRKRLRSTCTHSRRKKARSCKWYNKGKLQSLTIPGELDRGNDLETTEVPDILSDELRPMDEDPEDVLDDYYNHLYDFIPTESEENMAGPSKLLGENDEECIKVPHPTA